MAVPLHEIRLVGELTVLRGGSVVPLPPSKKTRALLAYLVVTGRPHLRERLCDLLWDGPSDPRAELRWSLSRIRPLVDDGANRRIEADHERVWFEPRGARVDLTELRSLLGPDPARAPVEALEAAAAAMRGELLEGLDLPGCYRYHAWCASERETVSALQATVLGALAQRLADRPEDALRHARAWVAADPFAQPAHAHVIRLLTELGRTREAIEYYEECRKMLARELGALPVEIEAARRRIRRAQAEPDGPLSASRVQRAPRLPSSDPDPILDAQEVLPLAGRAAETAALDELAAKLASGSVTPLLLVTGEPGIGKTRLLEELASRVRARSGTVLTGRPFEAEMVRPYGAWVDALRALPVERVPDPLRPALSPLLPHWGPGAVADRQELFDAVVELLQALAEEAPLALVIDDLQWLDEASAALLHFAVRTSGQGRRPLIATAGRTAELEENPAVSSLVRTVTRQRRLTRLELAPLSDRDTAQLAGAVAPAADAARVYAESGGNPLYAIEVARALARHGGAASDTLQHLIDERLEQLPSTARELLPWAAALGRSFELELLGRVADLTPAELSSCVAELERRRVLQTADEASGAYDFTHDLVRQGAYRRLSGPRRRLTHQHVARVIARLPDPDAALAADLAHHAALGGDSETAARACLAAGERCLRIFAQDEAAELARRGLQHAERLPHPDRLMIQAKLLRLFVHSEAARGRARETEAEIARVVRAAEGAGLAAAAHVALHALSYLHWRDGDFATAASDSLRSAEAARAADPRTTAHALADTARCLAHLERDLRQAETLLGEAEDIAGRLEIELVDIPWARGLLRQYSGEHEEAARHLEDALRLARAEQHRWAECDCLTHLAMLELETGRPLQALARLDELLPVAEKMGEGSEAPFAAALDALARYALRQPGANASLEAALAGLRAIDSNLLLAYILTSAADVDLSWDDPAGARHRAEEAARVAERVRGRSMRVLAHALLARVARADGSVEAPSPHLEVLRMELASGAELSGRASSAAVAVLADG
jgi:DNA-binding SARP family transcriptional activator